MTTRSQLAIDNLNFLNGGNELLTITATSDGLASFTSNTGDVFLRGIKDPTNNNDAATKNYVDSIATAGASWKNSVRGASTGSNIALTGIPAVTDGITYIAGERILLKDQTNGVENGIWVISAGAWSRGADLPVGTAAAGAAMWINEGVINGDKGYICTNDSGSDVVGTDSLNFTNFSGIPGLAGSDTQVQYNNNGNLGADANFTWNHVTGSEKLTINNTTSRTTDVLVLSQGTLSINDGDIKLSDSDNIIIGTDNDITLTHDGSSAGSFTNTVGSMSFVGSSASSTLDITGNGTGNTIVANTAAGELQFNQTAAADILIHNSNVTAGSDIQLKLGTNDGTTSVLFTNSDSATIMSVGSDLAVNLPDDVSFVLGGGDDFSVSHNGTSGDTVFDNNNITGDTVFQLGTTDTDTNFIVEDSAGTDLFTVSGDGSVSFSGGLNVSSDSRFIDDVTLSLGTPTQAGEEFTMVHEGISKNTIFTNGITAVDFQLLNNGTGATIFTGATSTTSMDLTHEGTGDFNVKNTTAGNLHFENSFATGNTVFKMGDTSNVTSVKFTNSADTTIMNIGSDSTTNSTSTVTGAVQITGGLGVTQDVYAQSFNASSDATLKTNIEPLSNPLKTLNKIEGYSYDWIKDENDENAPKQWGVLAQQLEEVGLGHMVSNGTVKAVNYLMLVPLLIEAVKELTRLTLDETE